MGEMLALPGKIVVVKKSSTPLEDPVEHVARTEVERERGEVLDDNEVEVTKHALEFIERGWRDRVDGESLDDDVSLPGPGDE
jgi:hypothetical protein